MALPTGRGLALLAAGGAAYFVARILGTWELYVLATGLAAMPVLAWVLVALTASGLRGRRAIDPEQPVAGDPIMVGLRVENRSPLPGPQLTVSDLAGAMSRGTVLEIDSLRPLGERLTLVGPLAAHRGVHRLPAVLVHAEDPLGLASARLLLGQPLSLTIPPRLARLPSCALIPGMSARRERGPHGFSVPGSSDLRSVRPYHPGEPLNRIHWKATAHTGTLMFREMDEPVGSDVVVVLDVPSSLVAGTPPETNVELAVQAAGSIADFSLRAGRTVTMLLHQGEWRHDRFTPGVEGRALLLESLARVTPSGSARLGSSLRLVLGRDGRWSQPLGAVVLVVLALGRELEHAVLRLRDDRLQTAVVYVDGSTFEPGAAATREDEPLALTFDAAGVRMVTLRRGDDLAAALTLSRPLWQHGTAGRVAAR